MRAEVGGGRQVEVGGGGVLGKIFKKGGVGLAIGGSS